jgi:putative ABC transport system permease protein
VSPGFLQAIRAPLVRGRHLTDQDGPGAPRVAIVDSELANRYWPKQDPIGKRIAYGGAGPDGQQSWITVVGVVGHVKQEGLDAEPRAQVYLPYRQNAGSGTLSLVVRTAGDPLRLVPTVREAVRAVDKDVPLANVASMESLLEKSVGQRRLSMLLIALFSAVALLMACVGIYGVMSYAVAQRTREMGVRVALGAKRSDVLGLVLREGMGIALLGVALGLAGAFALTRLIQSQLYDVKASDPSTYMLVALLLALTTLAATLVPALRATRVDPMVALREE